MPAAKPTTRSANLLNRRGFIAVGALAPWVASRPVIAQSPARILHVEYLAAAPPALPPSLKLDPPARLIVSFEGSDDSLRCSLGLRVVLDGESGLLPLAVWTGDSQEYWRSREALHLPTHRGVVAWGGGRWSLALDGRPTFSAGLAPEDAITGPERSDLPWFTYRFALSADWTDGPLGDDRPQIWRLRPRSPTLWTSIDPRACGIEGDLDGWLSRLGASEPIAAFTCVSEGDWQSEQIGAVDRRSLEAFAFRNYRSGTLNLVPKDASFASAEALEAYRGRRDISQTGLTIISVDAFAGSTAVHGLVPPPCAPIPNGAMRVLAVRGLDDPSLDEAWLLVECALQGRRVWYALSHLRPTLAGSAFGREVFGYPTKSGSVNATVGGNRFAADVSRHGASMYRAEGLYGGFSTGTSLAEMDVATLRLRPVLRDRPPSGEIVVQRWYYQGLRKAVNRASLDAAFPVSDGKEVWNRIGPVRAYSATILDTAAMQRLPGNVVSEVVDVGSFYRDRCDGRLPWEAADSSGRPRSSD